MGTKSIAILTSGGDAPGMNAAIRAVARAGISNGMRVIGVRRGYNGLISGDVFEMNLRSVSDIIHRGGTTLFTARSPEFNTPAGVQKAADTCRSLGIDGVVVIGGDGSFRGARDLTGAGIPCVGLPGTIDNDIQCSEYTIGFDTAMNTAMAVSYTHLDVYKRQHSRYPKNRAENGVRGTAGRPAGVSPAQAGQP